MKTYDVVYYRNGERVVREGGFTTKAEAEEMKEIVDIGWECNHVIEEVPDPNELKVPSTGKVIKDVLVTGLDMLLTAVINGYGRRD